MAYLSNLAVDTQFRRQGIGRQLLDHAIQVCWTATSFQSQISCFLQ